VADNVARTSPAPKALATPSDLEANEVQAIADALNPLIADAFALYTKIKNYHWHLSGSHFKEYHEMLDEHADQALGTIDPLAERVRKVGGTTIRSISHISSLQNKEDDNDDFVEPVEMLRRLVDDNRDTAARARAAHEVVEECRDYPTSDLLEDVIDGAEERMWFLYELARGEENTA